MLYNIHEGKGNLLILDASIVVGKNQLIKSDRRRVGDACRFNDIGISTGGQLFLALGLERGQAIRGAYA